MLELKEKPVVSAPRVATENKQPRRLVLALVLLLFALAGVLVKDRQFWFGTSGSLEADEPEVAHQTVGAPAPKPPVRSVPTLAKKLVAVAKNTGDPKEAETPAIATTRTVLPPLDVEVVAGDTHRTVHPGSNSTKVDIPNTGAASFGSATSAAERERMSIHATPNAAPDAAQPPKSYPLLAQHMNVQGSVVLQAIIGADGIIQNLKVLSGPGILSPAAQQAVREWRFKPIIQNGQAVESKATITVNFSINVADGSAKTTLAESRMDDIKIITR